jgi:hypothetical protein
MWIKLYSIRERVCKGEISGSHLSVYEDVFWDVVPHCVVETE